jgi:hypothetical protein
MTLTPDLFHELLQFRSLVNVLSEELAVVGHLRHEHLQQDEPQLHFLPLPRTFMFLYNSRTAEINKTCIEKKHLQP